MTAGAVATPASRLVQAHIEVDIHDRSTQAFAVAAAGGYDRDERLRVTLDGDEVSVQEIAGAHDTRIHIVRDVGPGALVLDYEATVVAGAPPAPADDEQWLRYLRPSRYCESDKLGQLARAEFAGLDGFGLVTAVSRWVGARIAYVPGSSRPIDGAVATLLAREGVCRDFAHLTTALLRANDVAARVVSVYAPGLDPMDFHAVTEALVDGTWYVIDPTGLAPRQSLVRIATGADAADIAFLTTIGGRVELTGMWVGAVANPTLPFDDVEAAAQLR